MRKSDANPTAKLLSKDEARKIAVKQPSNHWLLTWRISALRSCVDIAVNDFGSWGRHGLRREYGSWGRHGLRREYGSWGRHGLCRRFGSWGRHGLRREYGSWGRHGLCRRFGSWERHGLRREYGSSRMHGRYPERPAMVGAEPNKMCLGKLGTCLAFRHAGWRAISQ
jgi:hypothetical protein